MKLNKKLTHIRNTRNANQTNMSCLIQTKSIFNESKQVISDPHIQINKSISNQEVFECLFYHCNNISQELRASQNSSIKIMDTIFLKSEFQPILWLFTDLLGRIQYKDIQNITITDVIKAFLVNLNENKKNEFTNQDLMNFLESQEKRTNICFALVNNQRYLLNIEQLSNIKNLFENRIEALQLFKIPTRTFHPYFYFHTISFKTNQQINQEDITKLSHNQVKINVNRRQNTFQQFVQLYEEELSSQELSSIPNAIIDISDMIISKFQKKNASLVIKEIKLIYLIEDQVEEPWFMGIEFCNCYQKYQSKKRPIKNLRSRKSSGNDQRLNLTTVQSKQCQDKVITQDVYQLSDYGYITKNQLYSGLQQIGEQYGKDETVKLQRPKTSKSNPSKQLSKLNNYYQQRNEQRQTITQNQQKLVNLFPKYLEKSNNKKKAKFLFGNQDAYKNLQEYSKLRLMKGKASNNLSYNVVEQFRGQNIFDINLSEKSQSNYQQIGNNALLQMNVDIFQDNQISQDNSKSLQNNGQTNKFLQMSMNESINLQNQKMPKHFTQEERQLIQLIERNKQLENIVIVDKTNLQNIQPQINDYQQTIFTNKKRQIQYIDNQSHIDYHTLINQSEASQSDQISKDKQRQIKENCSIRSKTVQSKRIILKKKRDKSPLSFLAIQGIPPSSTDSRNTYNTHYYLKSKSQLTKTYSQQKQNDQCECKKFCQERQINTKCSNSKQEFQMDKQDYQRILKALLKQGRDQVLQKYKKRNGNRTTTQYTAIQMKNISIPNEPIQTLSNTSTNKKSKINQSFDQRPQTALIQNKSQRSKPLDVTMFIYDGCGNESNSMTPLNLEETKVQCENPKIQLCGRCYSIINSVFNL